MPRLHLLRPHRRAASNQQNSSAAPTPQAKNPVYDSGSISGQQPPPRTAPPTASPADAPSPIGADSSPIRWQADSPPTNPADGQGAGLRAKDHPARPVLPRIHTAGSVPTSKPRPSGKPSLAAQVKAANAALASQPSQVTAPAGGSSNGHGGGSGGGGNRSHSHSHSLPSSYLRNNKLTLLNPMSLLTRRRSSQTNGLVIDNSKSRTARDLPDDFDPGIIYGTRHPDWSNPPKKGQNEVIKPPVNGRSLPVSPMVDPNNKLLEVEAVADDAGGIDERLADLDRQRTPVFREHFEDEGVNTSPSPESVRNSAAAEAVPTTPTMPSRAPPEPPRIPATSPPATHDLDRPRVVAGGILPSSTETTTYMSRASSSASSAPPDSGDADDGRRRGVTLVDHPLSLTHHLVTNSSRFSFEASIAAESCKDDGAENEEQNSDDDDDGLVLELDYEGDDDEGFSRANEGLFEEDSSQRCVPLVVKSDPPPGIGVALSTSSPVDPNTPTQGLGLVGVPTEIPLMDPEPAPLPKQEQSLVRRLANPRGLDLSDDSDLDGLDQGNGMAGYEDEDDDLYFDDGIILDDPVYKSPLEGADANGQGDLNAEQRVSFPSTQGISSGGAMEVEDGSLDTGVGSNEGTVGGGSGVGNKSFPPFLNPIGGGLGCTQQHAQFYAPDGTMIDSNTGLPLALSALTHQLYQYQKQQQREAEAGYESDYNDYNDYNDYPDFGSQSGYYSVDDDEPEDADDSMVAEANAEALAYDTEFYGQEFGFYPLGPNSNNSEEDIFAGGYFGRPGHADLARPIIRRPSLTPISERSESSYRNSLVFPLPASRPLTGIEPPEGDMTLEQLMRLRRNAWGGSNGSLRSSLGGGSPINRSASPIALPSPTLIPHAQASAPPPGLVHAGKKAMLPTKASFEETGLQSLP